MRIAALLALTVALAFSIRVIPSYRDVMTPDGVTFQDDDSWFHMRAVQDAAAHFPHQSTFDPYGAFPGGQELQVDRWDLGLAAVAWVLGLGKPSAHLVDLVGAWMPAILGALLPLPLFFLGWLLFGELAGLLGAIAVAVIPGILLWETHLGVPDHHVAECFLAFVALLFLCKSADSAGQTRLRYGAYAGLALGAYLCVRPAGIFVPGIFGIAALSEASLALPVFVTIAGGSVTYFLCAGASHWARFTGLSLACALAAAALAWITGELAQRRQWRRPAVYGIEAITLIVVAFVAGAIWPKPFSDLLGTIRYFTPGGHTSPMGLVAELSPLWTIPPGGFAALFANLGIMWVIALPGLVILAAKLRRDRRPLLTLFAVWAVVMIAGGFLQLRMTLYAAPVLCLLAGAGASWAIEWMAARNVRMRTPALAALAFLFVTTSLTASFRSAQFHGSLDPNWRSALTWLSRNSPEPMGDPQAWSRLWTRPADAHFHYPPSAYGVLTWWDYGYVTRYLTHRIPNANGEQTNADTVAQFLTTTSPDRALSLLKKLGTRYAIVDPAIVTRFWRSIVIWSGSDDAQYRRTVFAAGADGKAIPLVIYLPEFYQSMASRLYIFDGKADTAAKVSVFVTHKERTADGKPYDALIAVHEFPSRQQAVNFMASDTSDDLILGSADPTVTCVDLEDLPWATRVFTSDPGPLRAGALPAAVKVFEITQRM